MMRQIMIRGGLGLALVGALAACDNSGTDLGFGALKTNVVIASVYLDRDGSRTPSFPTDTLYPGARVALLQRGTTDTVKSVLSDARGIATLNNVGIGEYTVVVSPAGLGDSVQVASIDTSLTLAPSNLPTADISVRLLDDTTAVFIRLSYPEVSLRQARNTTPGKRVFVRGIVLAGYPVFRDSTAHLSDTSGFIRLTRVALRGGIGGIDPGDSVTVLGLTSSRLGQPTLDQAVVTKLSTRPAPLPSIITTVTAATAAGGALDAALVLIQNGLISDTATIAPDYRVTVSDGSGSLNLVLDANLNFVRSAFVPGKRVNARGVLVPDGAGGWSLKPRAPSDVVIF